MRSRAPRERSGYYAMPLLWRDDIIGWVNASNQGGKLTVKPGFKKAKPKDAAFRAEFRAEVARLETFLQKHTRRPLRRAHQPASCCGTETRETLSSNLVVMNRSRFLLAPLYR